MIRIGIYVPLEWSLSEIVDPSHTECDDGNENKPHDEYTADNTVPGQVLHRIGVVKVQVLISSGEYTRNVCNKAHNNFPLTLDIFVHRP